MCIGFADDGHKGICGDWIRGKGAAVVPIRVGRSVVRVDVARAIVRAIVQVAATTDSTHNVGIHEVGGSGQNRPPDTLQSRLSDIITDWRLQFPIMLQNNEIRYSQKNRRDRFAV